MPILRPFSRLYPRLFPAGYSGSQVLRFALRDGPEQRLYQAGDAGLYGHKDLSAFIWGYMWLSGQSTLSASLSGYAPADLPAYITGSYWRTSMQVSITGVRCQTLSSRQYMIGYESGVPQFIDGRSIYRCVDFLPAFLRAYQTSQKDFPAVVRGIVPGQADLGSYIIAGREFFTESRNLSGLISGYGTIPSSLSASIVGSYCQALTPKAYFIGYEDGIAKYMQGRARYRCVGFLGAAISKIYYEDLSATIFVRPTGSSDLGAWLRQMYPGQADLGAFLEGLTYKGLPGEIYPIPPKDLPGYLKVWPMVHLPGHIRGWQEADLGAIIDWNDMRQLPAYIDIHPPKNLGMLIKGWVREATYDLGGWIKAFQYEDLGGIIRGTYLEDFPAYLSCIEPENLQAFIHGWQTADLSAYLNGVYGPHDLQAYINVVGEPRDLPAYLRAVKATEVSSDLSAYLNPASILMQQANLASMIAAHSPGDLGASLIVSGASGNLPAFIYPKMVYMTTMLSVSTMEHANLGGVINFVCRGSGYKNLGATIEFSYLGNLAAQITGKKYPSYLSNLGATVGYAANYVFMDRVPVSLTVGTGYSIEDKIPIILDIYKQQAYLSATITGTYRYEDVGAAITPVWLQEYEFDNIKVRELVYDLNHARQVNWYEVVELYFKSIVDEYFYVGEEGKVYKTDRTDKWRLDVASFIPADIELNVRRKLHRVRTLYDLTKFNNMDEAIRFAIHYVTSYDYGDLSSIINATGGYVNLLCSIRGRGFTTDDGGLAASISAQQKSFVLGYDDKVEFI